MKNIFKIVRLIVNELPKPLGRWRLEYSSSQIKNKIDLANEDHCGPCGQYAMEKMKAEKKEIKMIDEKLPPKTQIR